MKFSEPLPAGVSVVKVMPGLKASIVACGHAEVHRVVIAAVTGGTKGTVELCSVCKGDARTTKDWTLPVRLLGEIKARPVVAAAPEPAAVQAALF